MYHQQPTSIAINLGTTLWDQYKPVLGGVSSDWTKVRRCLLKGGFRFMLAHKKLLSDKHLKVIHSLGDTLEENENILLIDLRRPVDWGLPDSILGPQATTHHAESLIGEFGIQLDNNIYISEKCPILESK